MTSPTMKARWIPPAAMAVLIEALTSWPNPPSVPVFHGADKVVHLTLYAVFAFLLVRAAQPGVPKWYVIVAVLVVMCAWAALDEWHQLFIAHRTADVADWAADVGGAIIGVLARRFQPRLPAAGTS